MPADAFQQDTVGNTRIGSCFLLYYLGLLISQDVWQRVFTARSGQVARQGTILVAFYCMAYALATVVIGMVAWVVLPSIHDPQPASAAPTLTILSPAPVGLVVAGSLSAVMSTVSGPPPAFFTLLASDVYRRLISTELRDTRFLAMT